MRIRNLLIFITFLLSLFFNFSASANLVQSPETPKISPELFVKQVAFSLFNYNYQNYDVKLQKSSSYFTNIGWEAYKAALEQSKNIESMKKLNLTMSGEVSGPVNLSEANDEITATFPVTVIYKNNEGESKQTLQVTMKIINMSKQWKVEQFFSKPLV